MGEWVKVQASDGQTLEAYVARPEQAAKGGLVLVQEIFGVNAHIRAVAESYAAEGYLVIAPALFDRFELGVQLTYGGQDTAKAFELYAKLDPEKALLDVAAGFHWAQQHIAHVAVLGFCYGGLMAWLSATRGKQEHILPSCTVGYYAGGIGKVAQEQPVCPVMLHFGAEDTHIGSDQIESVRSAHPEVQIYVYEGAGHAFNRDADPNAFRPEAAALARRRTLAFLDEHLAKQS